VKLTIHINDEGQVWVRTDAGITVYLTTAEVDVEGLELQEDCMLSNLVSQALRTMHSDDAPRALRPFYYPTQ
jgi:hypothetical protein